MRLEYETATPTVFDRNAVVTRANLAAAQGL